MGEKYKIKKVTINIFSLLNNILSFSCLNQLIAIILSSVFQISDDLNQTFEDMINMRC